MKKKPYKFDNNKKKEWLNQYKLSVSITNACNAIGISRMTIYDAFKTDKKFHQQKEDIDNLVDDSVENRLYALTKESPVACFFWLCNRRKDKWQNINKVEHTGNVENPLRIQYVPAKNRDNGNISEKQGE